MIIMPFKIPLHQYHIELLQNLAKQCRLEKELKNVMKLNEQLTTPLNGSIVHQETLFTELIDCLQQILNSAMLAKISFFLDGVQYIPLDQGGFLTLRAN